ncbi:hypothetical protein ALI22I_20325 [Saccharothrix sp. ALI-22-I]|uniref:hypothetical protein n=1 Tax=Saccharothrix sp. ALI-22-I TaxID=1933778 RepID=UPI00097C3C5A|nr:hypothetical protein [Saccharothrix sp. ALI-22-I]ONI88087.1 hypothetical protein ALI22I_20325 [Saccharothrix sp. ALI-22-I]
MSEHDTETSDSRATHPQDAAVSTTLRAEHAVPGRQVWPARPGHEPSWTLDEVAVLSRTRAAGELAEFGQGAHIEGAHSPDEPDLVVRWTYRDGRHRWFWYGATVAVRLVVATAASARTTAAPPTRAVAEAPHGARFADGAHYVIGPPTHTRRFVYRVCDRRDDELLLILVGVLVEPAKVHLTEQVLPGVTWMPGARFSRFDTDIATLMET